MILFLFCFKQLDFIPFKAALLNLEVSAAVNAALAVQGKVVFVARVTAGFISMFFSSNFDHLLKSYIQRMYS